MLRTWAFVTPTSNPPPRAGFHRRRGKIDGALDEVDGDDVKVMPPCGDSGEITDIRALMGRERAAMIFADPPFNVRIGATVGRGRTKYREFAEASGEMSFSQFTAFLTKWMRLASEYSTDGSIHFICIDWRHLAELHAAGIRILHHKTGAVVLHPLEEKTPKGNVRFYEEAEEVLAKLPKRGVSMILREVAPRKAKPFAHSSIQHIVQRMRKTLKLPAGFTLDACRHGGMTELEEAELTDGQRRALSAHRTQQSYERYAKRNMNRALSATRKRHAHRLANEGATVVQNRQENGVRMIL